MTDKKPARKITDEELESALRYLFASDREHALTIKALRIVLVNHGISEAELDAEVAHLRQGWEKSFGAALTQYETERTNQALLSLLERLDTTGSH